MQRQAAQSPQPTEDVAPPERDGTEGGTDDLAPQARDGTAGPADDLPPQHRHGTAGQADDLGTPDGNNLTGPAERRATPDQDGSTGRADVHAAPTRPDTTTPDPDVRPVARTGQPKTGSTPAITDTVPWHLAGTGPVPTAGGRVRKRWRKVAVRTLSKAWGDSLFGMSSQAAFWSALSTAPLLLALLGLVGYVAGWIGPGTITDVRDQVTVFLHAVFNEEVADNLVGNTVDVILNNGQADVVSIGLLISLWAGSSAMSAFVESITIAYCQHEHRHPVVERFFALGLYVGALAAGIVVVPLLAIGPDYLPGMFPSGLRPTVSTVLGWVYYPGLAIGLILLLTTLYKVAPKRRHAWKRGLPGAFLAAAVFLVASGGLRLYLSYVYSHGLTYGALATPITFLLFYYFASMAIIIGAQFNNALLEYYPPRLPRRLRQKYVRKHPEARAAREEAVSAGAAAVQVSTAHR